VLTALRRALELKPGIAEWARGDEDLESLRGDPGFQALLDR
jgi:hypothetical protein